MPSLTVQVADGYGRSEAIETSAYLTPLGFERLTCRSLRMGMADQRPLKPFGWCRVLVQAAQQRSVADGYGRSEAIETPASVPRAGPISPVADGYGRSEAIETLDPAADDVDQGRDGVADGYGRSEAIETSPTRRTGTQQARQQLRMGMADQRPLKRRAARNVRTCPRLVADGYGRSEAIETTSPFRALHRRATRCGWVWPIRGH